MAAAHGIAGHTGVQHKGRALNDPRERYIDAAGARKVRARDSVTATFELELQPERANVALARRFVIDAVHRLGMDQLSDVVELLASEVVTNAVLHAGTELHVRVFSANGGVRIEVSDGAGGAPTRRNYSPEAATGRGMGLVEALASDWGTTARGAGKTVWFTVDAEGAV